jgi:hypothetical protein
LASDPFGAVDAMWRALEDDATGFLGLNEKRFTRIHHDPSGPIEPAHHVSESG